MAAYYSSEYIYQDLFAQSTILEGLDCFKCRAKIIWQTASL